MVFDLTAKEVIEKVLILISVLEAFKANAYPIAEYEGKYLCETG
ncbi:MAG: hypothetical protein V3U57_05410 [Robiginitomaculum sp.]